MKKPILRLLAVVSCVWAVNAYAKITLNTPPEVPTNLNAHAFKELIAKRNYLLMQLGEAQEKVDSQARDCHEVEEGSPKVGECRAKANEVKVAVKNYRAALERFKASLATSLDLQQSESNMDDNLSMSAKHTSRPIAIESHGEFYVVSADGRKLSGQEAAHLTEDDDARLVTGPDGLASLTLPDDTRLRLGHNTEFLTKAPDSKPDPYGRPAMELEKGTLRWIHELPSELRKRLNETNYERKRRLHIKIPGLVLANRGTEFECLALPDGSGNIKLYSGEVSITAKTGEVVTLKPGQMISFTKETVGHVTPIEEGSR